jgi:hypothetical protein
MYQRNENEWVMCANRRCCPVVRIEGCEVFITDDHGNTVHMPMDQFLEIGNLTWELQQDGK